MLEIDGSYGEGGGSIARVAIGLSVLTQKPVHIYNIRKNRPNPGLKTQHLVGIKAAADFCNGKLKGAELGSTEISFEPGKNFSDKVKVQIGTAGSVGLVLQTLQIAALGAEKDVSVEIKGGATYGKWAPSIDFVKDVTYKIFGGIGYKIDLEIEKHGFYPKGGARVNAVFHSKKDLKGLNLIETGKIKEINGISVAHNALKKAKVAERQKISARGRIFNELQVSAKIKTEYFDTESIGSGITLSLTTDKNAILGSSAIGQRDLRAEKIGEHASQTLIKDFGAGNIDRYAIDQVIPVLAVAKHGSQIRMSELSKHAHTNIWLCEQFFGKIFDFSDKILAVKPIDVEVL